MATIPNKRRELLTFAVANGAALDVTIPGSEHYTKFAISIPNTAGTVVWSLGANVPGTNEANATVPQAGEEFKTIVRQGVSSLAPNEITYDLLDNQLNVFDLIVPIPGGLILRCDNGSASAIDMTVGVMMYDSAYSASL